MTNEGTRSSSRIAAIARTPLARPLTLAFGLALVVIAQALVIVTGPGDPFVDDAWISLRYARNLIEGQGLVFNRGERVEGFTHPLWVLLDAIIVALRLPPRPVLSLLGVASWIAAALATRRAAREAGASKEAQYRGPAPTPVATGR